MFRSKRLIERRKLGANIWECSEDESYNKLGLHFRSKWRFTAKFWPFARPAIADACQKTAILARLKYKNENSN